MKRRAAVKAKRLSVTAKLRRRVRLLSAERRLLTAARIESDSNLSACLSTVRNQAANLDANRRDLMSEEQLNRLRYILADILATYPEIPERIAGEIRSAAAFGVAARPVRPTRLRDVVVRHHERIFGAK